MRLTSLFFWRLNVLCGIALTVIVMGGPGWAEGAAKYEALWPGAPEIAQSHLLAVKLPLAGEYSVDQAIRFEFVLTTDRPFSGVRGAFVIEDEKGVKVHQGEMTLDLKPGENLCSFDWHASSVAQGAYTGRFHFAYTSDFPPLVGTVSLDRVSSTALAAAADALTSRLDAFAKRLEGLTGQGGAPNLAVRLAVARDGLDSLKADIAAARWRESYEMAHYLGQAADALEAATLFSGWTPELMAASPENMGAISLAEGGLSVAGADRILFGMPVDLSTPEAARAAFARLQRLHLNFSVVRLETLPGLNAHPFDAAALGSALAPILEAAAQAGVWVVVQMDQETLARWILDKSPDVMDAGFANLAHPALRAALQEQARALAGALAGFPAVVGLSIAVAPKFKYDGDQTHKQFVERVRAAYPDRQNLNRAWRAHLADFDEITVWGTHPDYSYQNQSAYQFEWQTFHRQLIDQMLQELRQAITQVAPALPVTVTFSDKAFELDDTRFGANRESVAAMMDFAACQAGVSTEAGPYAVDFPRMSILYNLMRSYAPDKALLNLAADLPPLGGTLRTQRYGAVRTMLIEALISGASGLCIAPDSALLTMPEGMEALAVTALDAQRLAPLLAAFQQAPIEVGILFSASSNIMDKGDPHLKSAWYAFEGSTFAGYAVRFISEQQVSAGILDQIKVLIVPETPAVTDAAFARLKDYMQKGGAVARLGTPIPYNEQGHSRADVVPNTPNTAYVRGENMPTEYLHAMDALMTKGALSRITRPINAFGYPLEGVRSRFVEHKGNHYLYLVNLRKEAVLCNLDGGMQSGRDLLQGRSVSFPRELPPLEPMLIQLDPAEVKADIR